MSGPTKNQRREVIIRDEGACVKCGVACVDPDTLTPYREYSLQHRAARGMGGSKDPAINSSANLILLCGSGVSDCHGDVESNREDGRRLGYAVASHDDPELVPILNWTHGTAFLSTAGGWWPIGRDYQGTDYLEWITTQRGVPADSAEYLRIQERILNGLLGINGPNGITRDLDREETELVEDAWDREWFG